MLFHVVLPKFQSIRFCMGFCIIIRLHRGKWLQERGFLTQSYHYRCVIKDSSSLSSKAINAPQKGCHRMHVSDIRLSSDGIICFRRFLFFWKFSQSSAVCFRDRDEPSISRSLVHTGGRYETSLFICIKWTFSWVKLTASRRNWLIVLNCLFKLRILHLFLLTTSIYGPFHNWIIWSWYFALISFCTEWIMLCAINIDDKFGSVTDNLCLPNVVQWKLVARLERSTVGESEMIRVGTSSRGWFCHCRAHLNNTV